MSVCSIFRGQWRRRQHCWGHQLGVMCRLLGLGVQRWMAVVKLMCRYEKILVNPGGVC